MTMFPHSILQNPKALTVNQGKTITQKWNIYSCLADLSYALKVGQVHFHICFQLPLYFHASTCLQQGCVCTERDPAPLGSGCEYERHYRDLHHRSKICRKNLKAVLPCTRAWHQMQAFLFCFQQTIHNNKNKCKASVLLQTSELLNR